MALIFSKGKHAGKTLEWVEKNEPSYVRWAKENAPGIIKESEPSKSTAPPKRIEPPADDEVPASAMKPNKNFDSESGAPTFVSIDAACSHCEKKYKTYQLPENSKLFSYFCSDKCERQSSGEILGLDF